MKIKSNGIVLLLIAQILWICLAILLPVTTFSGASDAAPRIICSLLEIIGTTYLVANDHRWKKILIICSADFLLSISLDYRVT